LVRSTSGAAAIAIGHVAEMIQPTYRHKRGLPRPPARNLKLTSFDRCIACAR
jgi:hypothetical protein